MALHTSHTAVLSFLEDCYRQDKVCPTLREICEARGRSLSAIQNSLKKLEAAGKIQRNQHRSRGIVLVHPPAKLSVPPSSNAQSSPKHRILSLQTKSSRFKQLSSQVERIPVNGKPRGLPIRGDVAAGPCHIPSEADLKDNFSNFFDFTHETLKADYLLRVSGNSMIGAGILENALVGIRAVPDGYEPKEKEIVVALVKGEGATLKYFYREGDLVILKSANPAPEFKPLVYDTKIYEIKIQGVHAFTFNES